MDKKSIKEIIRRDCILPLFYHENSSLCVEIVRALYNAGIRCIEFTNRGDLALGNFSTLVKERNSSMPDLLLAIGTIKTMEDAIAFRNEGADLLISPVFDPALANFANESTILWIPGCMSPTEIHLAQKSGCDIVKIFPGNVLGTGFLEAIQPLFSGIDYVVTGGVEANTGNIQQWLKAGATAVGLGSKLINKEIITHRKMDTLTSTTRELLNSLRQTNSN